MKERPILFSAPMVRAILEGRKTQTRRVVKPQPATVRDFLGDGVVFAVPGGRPGVTRCLGSQNFAALFSPYGQPGDRLWVRETWMECGLTRRGLAQAAFYAADGHTYCDPTTSPPTVRKWKPSIHMPRWASRITLEVTGVRVERLKAISEADAIAEGIHVVEIGSGYPCRYSSVPVAWTDVIEQQAEAYEDPCVAYQDLWESINGTGSWDANPWVWVVEFQRVEVPRG